MRNLDIRAWLISILGMFEALLVGRLIALLLAANPANPFVSWLLLLSWPLAAPLQGIDAQQPVFGSRFERGTLLMAIIVAVAGYGLCLLAERLRGGRRTSGSYNVR